MNRVQSKAFEKEITLAQALMRRSEHDEAFVHLERAHVLGHLARGATAHHGRLSDCWAGQSVTWERRCRVNRIAALAISVHVGRTRRCDGPRRSAPVIEL